MIDDAESRRNSGPTLDAERFAPDGAASAKESTPAVASLEQRVAALEAEKAELDNYKKRARKEMSEHEAKARETILRDFLEVADNLERAIASWKEGGEKDVKSVRDGVELVLRLFKSKLERYSVTPFEAKGQPFDPRVHDVISQTPSTEATPVRCCTKSRKAIARVSGCFAQPPWWSHQRLPSAIPHQSAGSGTKRRRTGRRREAWTSTTTGDEQTPTPETEDWSQP